MGLAARCVLLAKGKLGAALDRAEDPREVLEHGYREQQRQLIEVRRGLVEVTTAKAQLDRAARRAHEQIPVYEEQAQRAVELGREDIARDALARKHAVLTEIEALERQAAEVGDEEARLAGVQRQLATRVAEFRSHKTILAARYSSASARVRAAETLTGVSAELAELNLALGRAEEKTERLQARAEALDALIDSEVLATGWGGTDLLGQELRRLVSAQAADAELAELKEQLGRGEAPLELGDGS